MKFSVIFVAAALVAGIGLSGHSQQSGTTNAAQKKEQIESHLFTGRMSQTIPERLAKTTGNLFLREDSLTEPPVGPLNPPPYPPYQLVGMACTSDAVVVGTALSRDSHLTADQTFLYSDWAFTANEVLKNNAKAPISEGSGITIVRQGGKLDFNGRKVYAIDNSFAEFQSGHHYLLFLTFLPEAGDYTTTYLNVFQLLPQSKVGHLSKVSMYPKLEGKGADALLQDTRAAVLTAAENPYCTEEPSSHEDAPDLVALCSPVRCRPSCFGGCAQGFRADRLSDTDINGLAMAAKSNCLLR